MIRLGFVLLLTRASCGYAQFFGGNADGNANILLIPSPCPVIAVNPFAGGNADGHSDIRLVSTPCSIIAVNPFAGGNADGHADIRLIPTPCSIIAVNPFAGGNADGHSDIRLMSTPCSIIAVNPFAGGNADGHSDIKLILTTCSVTAVNPFVGGSADGHSDVRLLVNDPVTCLVLPIELLFFNAKCSANKVTVTWATATQINNEYFTIERTVDAIHFTAIGKVNGAGNSHQVRNYSFMDNDPPKGTSYYRLTQTDFDGSSESFNLAWINCGDAGLNIRIYPNPNNGHFIIAGAGLNSTVIIINALGQEILNTNIKNDPIELDLSTQTYGLYFIQISSEYGSETKKIITGQY